MPVLCKFIYKILKLLAALVIHGFVIRGFVCVQNLLFMDISLDYPRISPFKMTKSLTRVLIRPNSGPLLFAVLVFAVYFSNE